MLSCWGPPNILPRLEKCSDPSFPDRARSLCNREIVFPESKAVGVSERSVLPALHSYALALLWVSFAPLLVKLKIPLDFGEEQGGYSVLSSLRLHWIDLTVKQFSCFWKKTTPTQYWSEPKPLWSLLVQREGGCARLEHSRARRGAQQRACKRELVVWRVFPCSPGGTRVLAGGRRPRLRPLASWVLTGSISLDFPCWWWAPLDGVGSHFNSAKGASLPWANSKFVPAVSGMGVCKEPLLGWDEAALTSAVGCSECRRSPLSPRASRMGEGRSPRAYPSVGLIRGAAGGVARGSERAAVEQCRQ